MEEETLSFCRSVTGVARPFMLPAVVLVLLLPPDPHSLGLTDLTVGKLGEGRLHRLRPMGVVMLVGEAERCNRLGIEEAARDAVL